MRISPGIRSSIICYLLFLLTFHVNAHNRCATEIGKFTSIEGDVEVQHETGGWDAATMAYPLCEADTIRIGEHSRAAIQLTNNSVLRLDQNTTLRLVNISTNNKELAWLDLGRGAIHAFSRAPWRVRVNAPFLKSLIKGTEFYVRAEPDRSELAVLEGHVDVESNQVQVSVNPGQHIIARAGSAPYLQTMLRPRDAVQWALYYPPILAFTDGRPESGLARAAPSSGKVLHPAGQGRITDALKALEQMPETGRDARFFLHRAALLLAVGRAGKARTDIAEALRNAPEESLAYALLSVIELTQNNKKQALAHAEKGVFRSTRPQPLSSRCRMRNKPIFKLEAARDNLLKASLKQADNALLWAQAKRTSSHAGRPRTRAKGGQ